MPTARSLAASSLSVLLFSAGCASLPQGPATIEAEQARQLAESEFGLPLAAAEPPDSPLLANLVSSYSGGDSERAVLVLVFDTPAATQQALERRRSGTGSAVAAQSQNVVVVYEGRAAAEQADRLARKLERAAG